MKYIVKSAEPAALADWKLTDKMFRRGNPNYDRIKGPLRKIILDNLKADQGNICCYCERTLLPDDHHLEHIKPQGIGPYSTFQCDYDNMLCCCQQDRESHDPKHCGMFKGSWYIPALFISPLDPTCESKFSYTHNGQILPAPTTDPAALTTIDKCKLDIDRLNKMREEVISTFIDDALTDDEVTDYVKKYLVDKNENNGSFNPFYTTVKFLFGHLLTV